jgi:hypothetical protein
MFDIAIGGDAQPLTFAIVIGTTPVVEPPLPTVTLKAVRPRPTLASTQLYGRALGRRRL